MSDLKLFVWTDVLVSDSSGIAFALAESVNQARDLIVSAYDFDEDGTNKGIDLADYRKWLSEGCPRAKAQKLWVDLQDDPDIYEEPVGQYIYGAD